MAVYVWGCVAMSSVYVLHGLRPWLIQRISAVYIALFVVYIGFLARGCTAMSVISSGMTGYFIRSIRLLSGCS